MSSVVLAPAFHFVTVLQRAGIGHDPVIAGDLCFSLCVPLGRNCGVGVRGIGHLDLMSVLRACGSHLRVLALAVAILFDPDAAIHPGTQSESHRSPPLTGSEPIPARQSLPQNGVRGPE